ncbi:hypothetical protein COCSADRAFT_155591 [Bipolaris sorokiniana ND90Pr]|uniref:Saccharopine dehydrogenase-like C-terminal domain-containing protein n=1 Tax=Cochliobolus sativus (strain ND90Pr / ATCC 201652) TaxID=665912 RepID=M2T4P1_COCSN|nr:uncharacterized protein COCSADRAFT_155591 [Bipolaris sorokiniana ND90Pr]EMD69405.1 hypothetical protein COCSADRAFT_155591 [Bipolaris sorokiniana ND90Pr]
MYFGELELEELSGGTYTLNQVILAKALKITKGDDLGKYTYQGASGQSVHCALLLQKLHHIRIPPARGPGPDNIVLRTGLLEQGIKDFKPLVEIFGKDLLPWEKEVANTIY